MRASDLILFTTVASTHTSATLPLRAQPSSAAYSLRDLTPEILLRSQNVVDDVDHVMKANTSPHLAEQKTGIEASSRALSPRSCWTQIGGSQPSDHFLAFRDGILDLAVGKWVYDKALAVGQDQRLTDFFYETVR